MIIDHANKWYMYHPPHVLENNTQKLLWDFEMQTDHLISARRPDLKIINKKKKKENPQNCRLCCLGWPQNKTWKNVKREISTLELARELKKLWNMRVTMIPIVIGTLDTVTKGLFKGLEDLEVGGRVDTIQTTGLLKTARILRRVLETWGDLLSLNLQWKPSANADVNNSNE